MKNYLHILLKTLLPTLAGCIAGSLLTTIVIMVTLQDTVSLATFIVFTLMAAMFAIVPSLLWGASLYALTVLHGRASYLSTMIIGAIPGFILYLLHRSEFTELCLYYGISIGACTHFFAKLRPRV
ncbi:hypothetical protein HNQ59_003056 [Chitinivorax tropicus]|uniref:Uncharacterized protein n=1 Tax=Chitinivorax tropicus TaxID=714531 RepID=A0A840MM88_9PROT|nr:hypothetical protein [Chitinivorax tropicus]MBB5019748.1 hypothetical protein [Chitinivorax tropicus]